MDIPFIKAKWFTDTGAKGRTIDLICIHDMEAPETDRTAENVARMFATTKRKASAHYNIDNNSIVQSVDDMDVAYHAPGVNHNSIGFEHAGYASQRIEDWTDPYSLAELKLSAELAQKKVMQYNIPIEFVDAKGLRAKKRGFTTHAAVSIAFKKSTHWDPGPGFPMNLYLDLVRGARILTPPPLPTPQSGGRSVVNAPACNIITHPSWRGYIVVAEDGGTFSFEAPHYGSAAESKLNAPMIGGASTPSGLGYWLVSADGGVYSFGDAKFYGSTGNIKLNKPVVGMAVSDTGQGYGLIASDGGLFAFGDFEYFGSVEYKG
jgi:hypothetical protein